MNGLLLKKSLGNCLKLKVGEEFLLEKGWIEINNKINYYVK